MKVRTTLFTLMIVFVLLVPLSLKGYANVIHPVIPENHLYILNLDLYSKGTYRPLSVRIDICNPDSIGHRYKVRVHLECGYLGFLTETREGYVENNSWATVHITLCPVLSGSRIFKFHLWQDGLHIYGETQKISIAKSSFEQSIENASQQVNTLQTALDNSNSEIDNLNAELDTLKANLANHQMQLNIMYHMVIGCVITLIAVIVGFSLLLYKRNKEVPLRES